MIRYRFVYLLISLIFLLFVRPFFGDGLLGQAVVDVLLLLVLGSSVAATATTRVGAAIGLSMLLLLQALNWFGGQDGAAIVTYLALAVVFFGYVTVLLTLNIFVETKRVSADTICGALSVYLLFGVGWAFAYALLEVVSPGAFSFDGGRPEGTSDFVRFIGFSFITLTTLGYGNIVPVTAQADALTGLQAVVGPVYLTVLVARLVALQMVHTVDRDE